MSPSSLARTVGRAALMAFYALSVLRLLERPAAARLLRPFAFAGRMPLSNYLLQTLMGSFVFYGWGLGFWGRASPLVEVAAGRRPVPRSSSCRSAPGGFRASATARSSTSGAGSPTAGSAG